MSGFSNIRPVSVGLDSPFIYIRAFGYIRNAGFPDIRWLSSLVFTPDTSFWQGKFSNSRQPINRSKQNSSHFVRATKGHEKLLIPEKGVIIYVHFCLR